MQFVTELYSIQFDMQVLLVTLSSKCWSSYQKDTLMALKVMPGICFRGNYSRYKEHNSTIW